jgi:hypothetical protein
MTGQSPMTSTQGPCKETQEQDIVGCGELRESHLGDKSQRHPQRRRRFWVWLVALSPCCKKKELYG